MKFEHGGGTRGSDTDVRPSLKLFSTFLVLVLIVPMVVGCLDPVNGASEKGETGQVVWIPDFPHNEGDPLEDGIPLYQMLGYYDPEYKSLTWAGDSDEDFIRNSYYDDNDQCWYYIIADESLDENSSWLFQYWETMSVLQDYLELSVRFTIEAIDFEGREYTFAFESRLDDGGMLISESTFVPTRFMVDGEHFWTIAEVEEFYDFTIPTPTKEGYIFTGWYEDEECTIPWTFMTLDDWLDQQGSIVEIYPYMNRFLYAGWEPDPSATPVLDFLSDPGDGDIQYVG